jgi:ABC-type polysaccharide/polyol phosphate export permease/predicted Zn-dependent protease
LSDALESPNHATRDTAVSGVSADRAPADRAPDRAPADRAPPGEQRAADCCRSAERLFYAGDRQAAVDWARAAFDVAPGQEPIAEFCAWLFSNCGHHQEAAAAYERLLACRPGWAAGHRHASGSFAVAGDLDRAIQHAARASEIEPKSAEFAIHAGGLLAQAGLHRDAIDYFARAAATEPDNPAILCRLSEAAFALNERQAAVDFAVRAHTVAPVERLYVHHLTELLLRSERFDEAAKIISAALAADDGNAVGYRLLSAAEMMRGHVEDAIAAIDRALALAPAEAEYHVHRGNLLYRIGGFDEAAAALDRAAALDPDNPAARRSQLAVYCDSGRFREALTVGGELIRTEPENEEYARAVLHVLNRRLETIDGDYIVLGERCGRPDRARPPPSSGAAALRTQCRVIHALIIRETRTRFGDSTLGYGWALIEPILHILTLSLFFAVLMHGQPPIGTQFFIFYYTGLIPYHVFVHTSSSLTYAVASNGSLLQLPLVSTFDVIVARAFLELATDLLVAVVLLAGFGALGLGTLPNDFTGVAASIAAVWVFACGCGFINAVINAFCKSWDKIWNQVTRILYFISGIFYVPGNMPDWIRNILTWNPVLHAVDWFRSGFFVDYEPHWLDRTFLTSIAVATLLVGLGLERALRRQLHEPQ